ncbi:MAG: hypothetical protein KF826_04745 [Xanthobacteraceae bacterium]|nr:hypothetical protein [Xanthobacteraceae bacterium]MBX3521925.1 hypothetical protein [Xanthobacteraceae bacterium]MBX3533639.1 hypothetical protein [Xanthobacteraceae bacterium]MBX3548271.1 hypothetical protein [Xanthobacteraceae bacterium]MCW5675753.1 hypothetical protein [Xanthobacteraceae bacterium]
MNTLRKKLTAIAVAGTVGASALATTSVPVSAAPVAPSQNSVKQTAPQQTDNVRWRRGGWVAPAIALGVIGAIAANSYHRRYYRPYYGPYSYYGPTYYRGYYPAYYGAPFVPGPYRYGHPGW